MKTRFIGIALTILVLVASAYADTILTRGRRKAISIFVPLFLTVLTPAFAQREEAVLSNFENSASSEQPNILLNGDFTYGLQCYGDWAWSTTGKNYKGDYGFFLSTDAHSPPYAAEIACKGSDCPKASIFTGEIPVAVGRSYLLKIYTKCPPGGSGYVYIPNTTVGNIYEPLSCNANWNLSQVSFTPAVGQPTISIDIDDTSPLPLLIDDIVLTFSDGTAPTQTWIYPGRRLVSVSPTALSVDGSPYLALGFAGVPYRYYRQVAALGANTIVGNVFSPEVARQFKNIVDVDGPTTECFSMGKSALDTAYELGLNVLPDTKYEARVGYDNGTFSPNGGGGLLTLPRIASHYGPHLANIGWFLDDEPDLPQIVLYTLAPQMLIHEAAALRSKSTLPVLVDFQHAHYGPRSLIAPYNGSANIWVSEPYGTDFSGITHATSLFNSIQRRPIWIYQDDIATNLIVPKAYSAIVNGVTGLIYWGWQPFFHDQAGLDAVKQVFSELKFLKEPIFGQSTSVTAPPGITAMGRQYKGRTYIFAVNPNSTSVTGSFTASGLTQGEKIQVLFEDRTITSSEGRFTDTFNGIARHVYIY